MNKLITLAIISIAIFTVSSASAQTHAWVEAQGLTTKVEGELKLTPTMAAMATKPFGSGIGGFAFSSATKGFGQIYAGPTFAPIKELELGLGAGLESSGSFRSGGYVWAGGSMGYALALTEHSHESGTWYRGIAALRPAKSLALGGHIQRYVGVGPYIELKLDNETLLITLWASPIAYDYEAQPGSRVKALMGLRAHF